MTPRARFLACLLHQPADRVSVGNAVSIATVELMQATGCFFPQAHLDAETMAGLAAAGHEILGYDTIAPVFSVTQESAALGCEVNWGHPEQMPVVRGRQWRCAADIDIPRTFPRHPACEAVLGALRLLRARYPQVALIGKVFGPWTLAYHLFGLEPFLVMTLDDPPQVHEIMRRLKDVAVSFATAQFEAGADAVTLGDHATGDLVSAGMYREFLQPIHTELAARIPGPVILHICGDTADRIAAIAQTGLACFHFDSKVPAQRAREIVGPPGPRVEASLRDAGAVPLPSVGAVTRPRAVAVPSAVVGAVTRPRAVASPSAVVGAVTRPRAVAVPLPSACRPACPQPASGLPSACSLMGNINNPQTLLRGTPEDVAREVQECLRCGIEIIAPECAVPLNTPTRNLQAVSQAVRGHAY